jgi:CheY-like chemotaxis protein
MSPSVSTPDVLIVDDDDMVRSATRRLLVSEGFTVAEASDGTEALTMLESGLRPRLVLLDLFMPGLGGLEVLTRIRASRDFAGARVFLMSASDHVSPLADGFVKKPVDVSTLLERVTAETSR